MDNKKKKQAYVLRIQGKRGGSVELSAMTIEQKINIERIKLFFASISKHVGQVNLAPLKISNMLIRWAWRAEPFLANDR